MLLLARCAEAHRLDEYLQGTLIELTRDAIAIEIQLVPGVAVLPAVMAAIDLNHDGRISAAEERAYAERVARDVELRVDGATAKLVLLEAKFPPPVQMHEGVGIIRIRFRAKRAGHSVRFENRHMPGISVYLVNCLAAPEAGLAVTRQVRDVAQRSIEFEYSFGPKIGG